MPKISIREALFWGAKELENISKSAALDSRLLLMHVLDYSQEELILKYNELLSLNLQDKFIELLEKRKNFTPIAYLIGRQEFYGLDFYVNENVLIPRPDTELIIDIMLQEASEKKQNHLNILELGTGSGAIAVTLAWELAKLNIKVNIIATDISSYALKVAEQNAKSHQIDQQIPDKQISGQQIYFVKHDLYENWDDIKLERAQYNNLQNNTKYDYIISNPPYISHSEMDKMAAETIRHEPDIALYALDNGLAAYKSIISKAQNFLKKDGKIILEIGHLQRKMISEILQKANFHNVRCIQDLAKLDRVIVAELYS